MSFSYEKKRKVLNMLQHGGALRTLLSENRTQKAAQCVTPLIGNIQKRRIQRWEVDLWCRGLGREQGYLERKNVLELDSDDSYTSLTKSKSPKYAL
jgi:hypothetical protein